MADDPPLPTLPEQELLARAIRIKPVMPDDDGKLHVLKPIDIEVAPIVMAGEPSEEVPGLKPLMTVTTLHSYSSSQFFMADIREVLAQIPQEILGQATAFQVRQDHDEPYTPNRDYHRATTTFYSGDLPESVRRHPVVYKGRAVYPTPEDIERTTRIKVFRPLHLKPGGAG